MLGSWGGKGDVRERGTVASYAINVANKVVGLVEQQVKKSQIKQDSKRGGEGLFIANGPGNLISPSPALTGSGQASEPLRPCTRPKQATAG